MIMIARNMHFEIVVPICPVEDNKRDQYHDEHKAQFFCNLKTHNPRMRCESSTWKENKVKGVLPKHAMAMLMAQTQQTQ